MSLVCAGFPCRLALEGCSSELQGPTSHGHSRRASTGPGWAQMLKDSLWTGWQPCKAAGCGPPPTPRYLVTGGDFLRLQGVENGEGFLIPALWPFPWWWHRPRAILLFVRRALSLSVSSPGRLPYPAQVSLSPRHPSSTRLGTLGIGICAYQCPYCIIKPSETHTSSVVSRIPSRV